MAQIAEIEKVKDKADTTYVDSELNKKVNVSDVVDNITSSDTDKPLSAGQGAALKALIDLKLGSDQAVVAYGVVDGHSDSIDQKEMRVISLYCYSWVNSDVSDIYYGRISCTLVKKSGTVTKTSWVRSDLPVSQAVIPYKKGNLGVIDYE